MNKCYTKASRRTADASEANFTKSNGKSCSLIEIVCIVTILVIIISGAMSIYKDYLNNAHHNTDVIGMANTQLAIQTMLTDDLTSGNFPDDTMNSALAFESDFFSYSAMPDDLRQNFAGAEFLAIPNITPAMLTEWEDLTGSKPDNEMEKNLKQLFAVAVDSGGNVIDYLVYDDSAERYKSFTKDLIPAEDLA